LQGDFLDAMARAVGQAPFAMPFDGDAVTIDQAGGGAEFQDLGIELRIALLAFDAGRPADAGPCSPAWSSQGGRNVPEPREGVAG